MSESTISGLPSCLFTKRKVLFEKKISKNISIKKKKRVQICTSMKVRSVRYMPRYGMQGGSTLWSKFRSVA
jgi:hypothetical protein